MISTVFQNFNFSGFQQEMDEIKDVFMRELREVNEKYMASERALAEMEQRYGGL